MLCFTLPFSTVLCSALSYPTLPGGGGAITQGPDNDHRYRIEPRIEPLILRYTRVLETTKN